MKNLLTTALLALILSACASSGKKIDESKLSTIKHGVTTRAQVEAQFGTPAHVSIDPATGNRILMYNYSEAHADALSYVPVVGAFAGNIHSKEQVLEVVVDKKGIVRDHELHHTSNSVGSGIGRD